MPPPVADQAIADRHKALRDALKGPDLLRLAQTPAAATPSETYPSGNSVIVDIEAAGLSAQDFTVRAGRGLLSVVTRKNLTPSRPFGPLMRTFPLPAGAKVPQIKASYQDGYLRVTIPVQAAPAAAGRRINVT